MNGLGRGRRPANSVVETPSPPPAKILLPKPSMQFVPRQVQKKKSIPSSKLAATSDVVQPPPPLDVPASESAEHRSLSVNSHSSDTQQSSPGASSTLPPTAEPHDAVAVVEPQNCSSAFSSAKNSSANKQHASPVQDILCCEEGSVVGDSLSDEQQSCMRLTPEKTVVSPTCTPASVGDGDSSLSTDAASEEANRTEKPLRALQTPQFLCEQPILGNPHIVNIHGIGDPHASGGMLTAIAPRAMIGDFEHQRENSEGVFAGKDVLTDSSKQLPQRLSEYIEVMIKDMKVLEIPQQMFVGRRSLDMFNLWKNRLYKHTIRKSARTAPRRAQIGDSIVSQVSMRFLLLEMANEYSNFAAGDASRPKIQEGFLINTFRDNSSWKFRIANVSGNDDADGAAAHSAAQLPWLRRTDYDDDDDDYEDDALDKNDNDGKGLRTNRMPVDHQATLQCIVLAASSMQEGEYSRFVVQLPTPFIYGPCRLPADSWLELELLINKIKPIGSLMRVLAAPLPSQSEATDEPTQQVVTFKDLQDAVETDRRECRVLFSSGRWKEALFVCWRLRDHIQRYHIPNLPEAEKSDDAEVVAARAAAEAARQEQQLDKDHLLSSVYVNISRCLSKVNDYTAACEAAEIALNYKAANTFAMYMSVRTLYRAGLYSQARDKLQQYRQQLPTLLADNDDFIKLATDLDKKLQLSVKAEQDCYRRMMRDFNDAAGMPLLSRDEPEKANDDSLVEADDDSLEVKNDEMPEKGVDSAVVADDPDLHDDADEMLKQMAERVDRKFVRQARQMLSRFRDNDGSISAPWPDLLSLDEAQFVKALNMTMAAEQKKEQTTDNKQLTIDVEIDESTMHVGKFLVMLRKITQTSAKNS